jgi:hypothetical protein
LTSRPHSRLQFVVRFFDRASARSAAALTADFVGRVFKGRSARSGGNVLTTLSCSASGIFAICCDLTRPTITRLARTFQPTRTRRRREQYMPLVAFCLRQFLADFIICMCEFDFRQAQVGLFYLISRFRRWAENDQGRKSKITAKAMTHKRAKVSMFNSQIDGRAY